MAHALASTGARILLLERGDFVPQEADNWSPDAVWRQLRYRTTEHVARRRRTVVRAVHALQRGRQHQVLGQRALSPAARGLRRTRPPATVSRRPGRSVRGARAVLRSCRAPLPGARTALATDPTEPPRGRYPYPPVHTRRAWRSSSSSCAKQGLHPSPLPLGLLNGRASRAGASSATPATRSPVRFTQRATRTSAACARRCCSPTITLWTNAYARRLVTDAVRAARSTRSRCTRAGRSGARRGAARHRLVRRRQLGALLLRSATDRHPDGLANSSGPGRAAATWPTWPR